MFGAMETRSEFFMAPKEVAHEHCKDHDGASFSWKKWRRTDGLGRIQNDTKFTDKRTWCRRRSPSFLEMQLALRNQSMCPQDGCNSLRIVGDGDSLQDLKKKKKPSLDVAKVRTQWRCTSCLVGPSAPGKLVGCSLLMASSGFEWWLWRQLASLASESAQITPHRRHACAFFSLRATFRTFHPMHMHWPKIFERLCVSL